MTFVPASPISTSEKPEPTRPSMKKKASPAASPVLRPGRSRRAVTPAAAAS
jgi:hypothetical protein